MRATRYLPALLFAASATLGACEGSSLHAPLPTGDIDDRPPECGVTPTDIVVMDACGMQAPCPEAHFYGRQSACGGPLQANEPDPEYSGAEYCVLDHLASGNPGRLFLGWECDGRREDASIYIVGEGEAMLAIRDTTPCEGACLCDETLSWSPLERCTLRDPAFFEACLSASSTGQKITCMDLESWFEGCGSTSASCLP